MTDFHSQRPLKATKKIHECDQCGRKIDIGSAAQYKAGKYFGDFYSEWTHNECHDAAQEYADMNGLWGEEYPWFQHMDRDCDWMDFLREKHPVVAGRLNITLPEADPTP